MGVPRVGGGGEWGGGGQTRPMPWASPGWGEGEGDYGVLCTIRITSYIFALGCFVAVCRKVHTIHCCDSYGYLP